MKVLLNCDDRLIDDYGTVAMKGALTLPHKLQQPAGCLPLQFCTYHFYTSYFEVKFKEFPQHFAL